MTGSLLKGVSHADYHADNLPGAPHFSRSVAVKLLHQSPLHAWASHPKLGGAPDDPLEETPEHLARLESGSLIHLLLLGAGQQLAVVEAADWRTNAAKDARQEARDNGLLPVLRGKYEAALSTSQQIRASLHKYGVELAEYEPEATCLWHTPIPDTRMNAFDADVACKARMDLLQLGRGEILDLKVQERINPSSFERGILPLGLDVQNAAYVEGVETVHVAMAGRVSLTFVLVERLPPFDVAIVPLSPALVDLGRQRWRRARKLWSECLRAGRWPGFGHQAPIEPKPWQLESEFSAALAGAEEL